MHALEVAVDIKELLLFLQISFSVFDITSPLLSHLLLVLFKVYMTHTEGHPVKKGKMVRLEKLDPPKLVHPLHPPNVPTDKNGWTPFGLEGGKLSLPPRLCCVRRSRLNLRLGHKSPPLGQP